jgi:hypothetical protein
MKTQNENPMVILPQKLNGTDEEKGMERRYLVLNGEQTKTYTVTRKHGQWACSCPAWKFHNPRAHCKHIHAIQAGPTPTLFAALTSAKWVA